MREHRKSQHHRDKSTQLCQSEYAMKKKRMRREKFLADMERVVPWSRLIAVIEPLYLTRGRVVRQPIGVPRMLRMYCLPQWYGLADEALEDALYDSQALRDFVGIDLSRESVPPVPGSAQSTPALGAVEYERFESDQTQLLQWPRGGVEQRRHARHENLSDLLCEPAVDQICSGHANRKIAVAPTQEVHQFDLCR